MTGRVINSKSPAAAGDSAAMGRVKSRLPPSPKPVAWAMRAMTAFRGIVQAIFNNSSDTFAN